MPDKKLTDKEIKKALEGMINFADMVDKSVIDMVDVQTLKNALDLINRLQAENKKFKDRQKPTGASGYKIEDGKVVFFTNMLGGCKIVKENLEEVVKTLNELLHEAYSKDEIAFALKCKTEENESLKAEIERLKDFATAKCKDCAGCTSWKCDCANIEAQAKAEAYNKFAYLLKKIPRTSVLKNEIDNLLNELVGGNNE